MKAVRFHEFGDINVLRYEEAPTTAARPWGSARQGRGDGVQPLGQVAPGGSHGRDLARAPPSHVGPDVAEHRRRRPRRRGSCHRDRGHRLLPMTAPGGWRRIRRRPCRSARTRPRHHRHCPTPPRSRRPRSPPGRHCSSTANSRRRAASTRQRSGRRRRGIRRRTRRIGRRQRIATASPRSVDAVRGGADHIIDYTRLRSPTHCPGWLISRSIWSPVPAMTPPACSTSSIRAEPWCR